MSVHCVGDVGRASIRHRLRVARSATPSVVGGKRIVHHPLRPCRRRDDHVSKAFRRLEELRLLKRTRDGSRAKVTLLDEGGKLDESDNLDPYLHPAPLRQRYLKVPHAYWEEAWHLKPDLRAKAVLLIALSLDDGFTLPIERVPDWYGISADTANRGLQDLRTFGLLDLDISTKKAPLAPDGLTQVYRYTLKAPFGPLRKPIATVTTLKKKSASG